MDDTKRTPAVDGDRARETEGGRLSCVVAGVDADGEEPRRLVTSAGSKIIIEAPDGPVHFTSEDRVLIVRAVDAAFKSVRP
jgi:hypothetical protein